MDHDDRDLDGNPALALDQCRASHARILQTVEGLDDEAAHRSSRLPGWTVAHVLTHLARNADGHAGRLEGALRGEEVPRYPGGTAQREADIQAGASRPAAEIVADLGASQARLEEVMARSHQAGWPNRDLLAGDNYPTSSCPARRLREAEMHHVDLGLGYEPGDWPEEYVAWELPMLVSTLPERLGDYGDRRAVMAWLAGRAAIPDAVNLEPW